MHGIGRTGAILSSTLGGMLMLAVPGHSSIFWCLRCRPAWRGSVFCCTV
nr:hypothetical protein [Klebsiella pneumoniae subsp. pneumoniae]